MQRELVLMLPHQLPQRGEGWLCTRERAARRLEPLQRMAEEIAGLRLEPLFAATSLHGTATPEQMEMLRHALPQGVEIVPWGAGLHGEQMEDVVRQIRLGRLRASSKLSGRGVTIAVLDSGIDLRHPYLQVEDSVSTCREPCEIPGRHGTFCAGVIASRHPEFPGIAPEARLLNVKVARANGFTSPAALARGIDEALDRGADILSLSFGLNHFPATWPEGHGWSCPDGRCLLCRAVDTTSLCGALVVTAAGNEHLLAGAIRKSAPETIPDTELLCPAQARGAITVGAIEKEPSEALYSASSRGPTSYGLDKPELLAPGVDVTSTIPVPTRSGTTLFDLFGVASGTSVAAAVVAGALALLIERQLSAGLCWSAMEIREELLTRCVRPQRAGILDLSSLECL